jgi:hypothetical protein
MADFEQNILDVLLDVGKFVTASILDALEPIFGHYCKIYFCQEKVTSIYGDDDSELVYSARPDITDRYIVLGVFNDRYMDSDTTFDQFLFEQPNIFTKPEKKLPRNAKVEVFQGGHKYEFRVIDQNVFNGNDGSIYVKNMLVPLS